MMPNKDQVNGAKAATGLFLASVMDGSVTDLTDDEAFELTSAAASVPEVAGKAFGLDAGIGDATGSARLQDAMLRRYYAAGFLRDFDDMAAEMRGNEESMKAAREEAAFRYAGMSAEDVERARFDAQMGDMSAIISAKERFYLG